MRVAGFNLGARFTLDDFATAGDIIRGDIQISLGSLDNHKEREQLNNDVLSEIEQLRQEMSKGVPKDVEVLSGGNGEISEVKASDSSIDEKSVVTVGEFSTSEDIDEVLSRYVGVENSNEETEENDEDYFGEIETLSDKSEVTSDEDTLGEISGYVDESEDDTDDDYLFDIEENTTEEEDTPEVSALDAELAKYLDNSEVSAEQNNSETVQKDKKEPEVCKTPTEVNRKEPKPQIKNPESFTTRRESFVNTVQNKVTTNQSNGIQSGKVSGTPGQVQKPRPNVGTAQRPVSKPAPQQSVAVKRPQAQSKPDYNSMETKELYIKYVRPFLLNNGVRQGTVKAQLLINEFGSDVLVKLTRGGYIMKRGNGYTMGI